MCKCLHFDLESSNRLGSEFSSFLSSEFRSPYLAHGTLVLSMVLNSHSLACRKPPANVPRDAILPHTFLLFHWQA